MSTKWPVCSGRDSQAISYTLKEYMEIIHVRLKIAALMPDEWRYENEKVLANPAPSLY